MKFFRDPRLVLVLIISLTLISAELDRYVPVPLHERLKSGENASVLLIGIDARPGEIQARGDTIVLLSISQKVNKVVLVSIPRDTRVVYQGANRKINMVNQYEGPKGLCHEVGKLMNIDLDYYIVVNFEGFKEIIDALGGVYLDVDIQLHSPATGVFLEKGFRRLSGREALTYARFRSNPDMDIGRTKRQQRLLVALSQQLMRKENLFRIPQLIMKARENVITNLEIRDLFYLGSMVGQFDQADIITQTLPGRPCTAPESGTSLWEPDREKARNLLKNLYKGS